MPNPKDDISEFLAGDSQSLVEQNARKHGVDPAFAKRILNRESRLRQDILTGGRRSSAGAMGPMQLMPGTAKGLGVNPADYEQNIEGGVRYLKQQMDAFGNDQAKAAAAYNAGPGRVRQYKGVPPFKETQAYVKEVAGQSQDDIADFLAGSGQQKTTPQTPSRPTRPIQRPTPNTTSPFSLDTPTGFQAATEATARRTAQISPEGQEAANLANTEATRFQGLSRTGQALDVVKAGGMRGAQGIGNMMRRVGQITTGQTGGKPALAPETEARLQRQEAAQNVALPNTAPVGRGLVSGAIQTIPALAAGTAGLPAAMLVGAGTQAANEDWSRPGRAAARIALNAAIPVGASKLAQGLIRPATALGRVASGTAGGAAGNVGAAAAEQAAFDGRLNPQDLAQQAVIGGVMGGITPPPKYQPRQGRLQPATPDQVFRYDADGNEINPQMGNVPESAAVQRIPQAPFDPSIAAPESTLTPSEIRAQYRRPQAKPLQEKLAGPPRETTPLRRTRGIDQTEPLAPDAPTTAALAPVDAEAPAAQAPEAPQRTYPVRDSLRAEADAAKIEAATLEQQGRMDEAAIKYDAAHRALTRLRRSIGTPKTEADASLLSQIDTEVSAAAQNRQNAKSGRRGQPRVTAPEVARETAPTKPIEAPELAPTERELIPPRPLTDTPKITPKSLEAQQAQPQGGIDQGAYSDGLSEILRARAPRRERQPKIAQDNPLANKSILARIRELGGIKPGQDSGELASAKDKRYPGLINRRAGIAPDELIQYLAEDGYPVDRNDLNTLWRAIDDDVAGGNVRPLDRQMNTSEVMGEGYSDYLRGEEETARPSSEPLPSAMFGNRRETAKPLSAMEQARRELPAEDQVLIQRALSGEPAPGRARQGMVSFSPYADLVANNRQAINDLSRMNIDSPEARPLVDQLDSFARDRRIDPDHVENLKNYLRNDQLEQAGMERRGVDPNEAMAPEPTANLRNFYSESDTLPEGASGRLSGRLPRPVTKTPEIAAKPPEVQRAQRPQAGERPAPELAYKGNTAPLDTTQPEQMPNVAGLTEEARARVARMSPQNVDAALRDAEAKRNADIRNPQMSDADRSLNQQILTAANNRRKELVKAKELPAKFEKQVSKAQKEANQWADSEFAEDAAAFKAEHGRYPETIREIQQGRPKTEPIATIQHERFGQVEVIEKAPNGKLVVEDADGATHTIKNPRTSGNRGAAFVKKPLTEELPMPVAEQVGKLPESAVAPNDPPVVAAARKRLRETATGRRANSGQALFDQAIVTGHQAYKAGMAFKDWSAAVIKQAGAAVEPHLRRAWAEIQKFHRDEGGAAKASPGPAPRPEPASATARSTRNLAGIRMEDLGTGGPKKRAPRREATPPTPETMKRAGLRDITGADLRTPAGDASTPEAAPKGKLAKVAQVVGDLYHGPKSLLSSADLSAAGRQGLFLSLPPSQWGKAARATGRQLSSLVSEKSYQGFIEKLRANPDYETAQKSKLFLATDDPSTKGFTERDESFVSNLIGKLPHVKISERAYKTYLDSIRMDSFAKYKRLIEAQPGSAEQKANALEAAADWINTSSGRGKIHGAAGEMVENATPLLNTIFFAPRYTISRFQLLNPATYARNLSNPQTRVVFKQQMSEMFQSAAVLATTGILAKGAGADISFDPDDADFLKLKFGNTRFDILGGVQGTARLAARIGEWAKAEGFEDDEKQLSARRGRTADALKRFGRGKLGPVPSFFVDWVNDWKGITGERHTPGEVSVKNPIASRVLPLLWNDVFEAWGRGYKEAGAAGGAKESAKFVPSVFGVGVQDYDRKAGAVGLEGKSKLSQELRRQGGKFDSISAKPGEPKEVHRERADKVEKWFSQYGEQLVNDPAYGSLTDAQKESAMQSLRRKIGAQANLRQTDMRGFAPGQIIRGVREGERNRDRQRGKFIWTPPED